jgi:hypothetical protein
MHPESRGAVIDESRIHRYIVPPCLCHIVRLYTPAARHHGE